MPKDFRKASLVVVKGVCFRIVDGSNIDYDIARSKDGRVPGTFQT